uniref:Uncharacterized LOC113144091 n=1 Tax=Mastacembelus armatus TaxID=205130 RepID=A0A3Q3MGY4_9TELE
MMSTVAAVILLSTMPLIRPEEVPQQISLIVVEVGGNVTFQCKVPQKEGRFFRWYKQSLGYMGETVAVGSFNQPKLAGQFDNPRFSISEGGSKYILTIQNVTKEDEATYFCQNGTAYSQSLANGVFLAVNDPNEQKTVYVKQTPETESVQPGDSVTLQCSLLSKNKENSNWSHTGLCTGITAGLLCDRDCYTHFLHKSKKSL